MPTIDIKGQKFGRLKVIERAEKDNFRQWTWLCKCDCGNEVKVRGYSLRSGNTQSCGCLQKEVTIKRETKHGMTKTRLHNIWVSMKERCNVPSVNCYKYYGGRGIKVCEEWKHSFESFRDWALANGYTDTLTIDRIDVNGNYEPSNCRWITLKEQGSNKTNNHFITYNGVTKTLQQWADEIGIHHVTLLERIERWGSVEEALTIPKGGKQKWGNITSIPTRPL